MPAILQNKKVLALIAVFVLVVFSLLVFGGDGGESAVPSSPAAPYLSVAPAASADAVVGQDLLAALALLKTIQLDTSVFTDPIFKSLSDWGKKIPPQPVGRRNPFAPFGTKPSNPAAKPASAPAVTSAPASAPKTQPPAPAQATPPASGSSDADVWDFSDIEFDF